jgi:GNAT superfamily N-acetyltransferase
MIRLACPDDAPRLDDVLADSFFQDPISAHLLPDASRRRDRLRLGMGHAMRTYIASDGAWTTDGLEGVALWAKPGDPKPSGDAAAQRPSDVRASLRSPPPASDASVRDRGAASTRRRHWFLEIIGVRPDRQGHGIGSGLMGAALTEIDSAALPAFLVTSNPSNLPFYEKLGFAVGEEYDIGPVHVWPMLRPAETPGR